MNIPTTKLLKLMLANLIAHVVAGNFSGALYGVYVGLYTNVITLGANVTMAELTEPTYTGYVRQTVGAWTGPFQDENGGYQLVAPENVFQMGDAVTPTTVQGYFLADALTVGNLLYAEKLAQPEALTTVDQAFIIAPVVSLDPGVNVGGGVQLE